MEPELSSDRKLFQATAREFLDKEYPLERIRGMEGSGPAFDRGWWRQAAELGWTSLLVPEELGGGSVSGRSVSDLTLLAEVLGAGVAPGPMLPVNVVLAGLVEVTGHEDLIAALVSGERLATWAVYEPGRPWEPLAPALTATPVDGGFRLDGDKDRVESIGECDLLLVSAMTPDGVAQFLVPADAGGVSVTPQWSVDLSRRFGAVRFDGVQVGAHDIVRGAAVLQRQTQIAQLIQCAEVCGGLDRVFAFTTQWAFDRYSFGRPIASYQALKHRFADMRTWLEACYATTAAAADAVQDRAPDAAELVSVAKSFVGDHSVRILQDCVQIHGGIGVTWEHDLHLFLRRATLNQSLYGTPQDHRLRLAELAGV